MLRNVSEPLGLAMKFEAPLSRFFTGIWPSITVRVFPHPLQGISIQSADRSIACWTTRVTTVEALSCAAASSSSMTRILHHRCGWDGMMLGSKAADLPLELYWEVAKMQCSAGNQKLMYLTRTLWMYLLMTGFATDLQRENQTWWRCFSFCRWTATCIRWNMLCRSLMVWTADIAVGIFQIRCRDLWRKHWSPQQTSLIMNCFPYMSVNVSAANWPEKGLPEVAERFQQKCLESDNCWQIHLIQ